MQNKKIYAKKLNLIPIGNNINTTPNIQYLKLRFLKKYKMKRYPEISNKAQVNSGMYAPSPT